MDKDVGWTTSTFSSNESAIVIIAATFPEKAFRSFKKIFSESRISGNGPSPRRSVPNTICETCRQQVQREVAETCRGCNQHTHSGCHETLTIGETWNMQMCLCCTNHVKHLLRIVRASEDKSFRFWREEEWFRTVLDAHFGESIVPETTNDSLIMLQNFMLNALRDNLHVWQSHSLRTPTAEADPSPTGLLMPAPARTDSAWTTDSERSS